MITCVPIGKMGCSFVHVFLSYLSCRYDMWWDVPHVDRHNRKWQGPWSLKTGP